MSENLSTQEFEAHKHDGLTKLALALEDIPNKAVFDRILKNVSLVILKELVLCLPDLLKEDENNDHRKES